MSFVAYCVVVAVVLVFGGTNASENALKTTYSSCLQKTLDINEYKTVSYNDIMKHRGDCIY